MQESLVRFSEPTQPQPQAQFAPAPLQQDNSQTLVQTASPSASMQVSTASEIPANFGKPSVSSLDNRIPSFLVKIHLGLNANSMGNRIGWVLHILVGTKGHAAVPSVPTAQG